VLLERAFPPSRRTLARSLVKFFGAFYNDDRTISVALEYMNGGSILQLLKRMGPLPEHIMAAVAYQVLWGLAYLKHEHRLHRVSVARCTGML
jgi:serine/threonine protein kinase